MINEPISMGRGKAKGLVHGQKTVTSAGTEEQLTTEKTNMIYIKALPTNTGYVYVGLNPVTSTTGYVLSKNEEIPIPYDASKIYIDVSADGEGVCFIGWR